MIRVIDVSHYQGGVDFHAVAASGVDGAYIKATEGADWPDPQFVANLLGGWTAGLPIGAYHYLTAADPEKQARWFLQQINTRPLSLLPALDVERAYGRGDGVAARALEWLRIVRAELDVRPVVYCGPAFAAVHLANAPGLAEYPLWVAHYTDAIVPGRCPPWPRDAWALWQWTAKARINGVRVPCDESRAKALPLWKRPDGT